MSDVVQFPEPQITIRVTDDPQALAESEKPEYDGPIVLSHDEYAALQEHAAAAGKSVQMFLRKVLTGKRLSVPTTD